eukprot:Skav226221  [mRNA]  locus=scaffold1218:21756:27153:- [translate_table: standard]
MLGPPRLLATWAEGRGEGPLRSLIQRPFGEDAIGWHVAVLCEDLPGNAVPSERENYVHMQLIVTGHLYAIICHIVGYSAETDAYLVAYSGSSDPPVIAWEQDRRQM